MRCRFLVMAVVWLGLLALGAPAVATALPEREARADEPVRPDEPTPVDPYGQAADPADPAPTLVAAYDLLELKQALDGCPTRFVGYEMTEYGLTEVYEADCPRSADTEAPPKRPPGLSPGAGKDRNKRLDITLRRLEEKLEKAGGDLPERCSQPGPAAGRTHAEILARAHQLTDQIYDARVTMADATRETDALVAELNVLRSRATALVYALGVRRPNQKIEGERDIVPMEERAAMERELEAIAVRGGEIGALVEVFNASAAPVIADLNGWNQDRDALLDDAAARVERNGRYCAP